MEYLDLNGYNLQAKLEVCLISFKLVTTIPWMDIAVPIIVPWSKFLNFRQCEHDISKFGKHHKNSIKANFKVRRN